MRDKEEPEFPPLSYLNFDFLKSPTARVVRILSEYLEPALLFERDGGRFMSITDPGAGAWLAGAHCDRGAAFGDLDADGDVDVVVSELNGPLRLLRNDANAPGWLIVELAPPALGSRIELHAGGARQTRWIYSGGSFVSASAQHAHFGVPRGHAKVDLVVAWPDGATRRIDGVAVDQRLIVRRE